MWRHSVVKLVLCFCSYYHSQQGLGRFFRATCLAKWLEIFLFLKILGYSRLSKWKKKFQSIYVVIILEDHDCFLQFCQILLSCSGSTSYLPLISMSYHLWIAMFVANHHHFTSWICWLLMILLSFAVKIMMNIHGRHSHGKGIPETCPRVKLSIEGQKAWEEIIWCLETLMRSTIPSVMTKTYEI